MMKKKPVTGGLQNISPKMMTMFVLLGAMGILWGRVLLKGNNGPASASAQEQVSSQQPVPGSCSDDTVQIDPVELPVLSGRNDRVSNDMFSAANWTAFQLNRNQNDNNVGVTVNAEGDSGELMHRSALERIAGQMTLETVICDAQNRPYQAFVDDKILSVGSTLTVEEGPDQYVLTLKEISQNEIVFSWNEISVVLKMAENL